MALLDVLLPPSCAGCGRYGSLLCDACRASFRPASPAAVTFVQADPAIVVGEALTLALAAFRYEGTLRRALGRLKYGGAPAVAKPLARDAAPALRWLLEVTGPATLVPVPVHVARLRRRGYNQAGLLAHALAREVRLPLSDCLVRTRATTRQHGLDRAARLRNLREAFAIRHRGRPPPTAIVVDDILTTAATLEACASVLVAAWRADRLRLRHRPGGLNALRLARCYRSAPRFFGRHSEMKTSVKARNLELTDRLRATIERKLRRLDRISHPDAEATVELITNASHAAASRNVAEVTLVSGTDVVRSVSSGSTPVAALDLVLDKLERQVVRAKRRPRRVRERAADETTEVLAREALGTLDPLPARATARRW